MCITSADIRGEEEGMVWGLLCDKCRGKAEALLDEREADSLFDIGMEEYGFCPWCAGRIIEAFDRLEEEGEEFP